MSGARVWLWLLPTTASLSDTQAAELRRPFSLSEQQRLAGIRSQRRQNEYLQGHQLLRTALSQIEPGWQHQHHIEHPGGEAPRLTGPKAAELSFNLSHSANAICCAVGRDCQLGIDIEQRGKNRRFSEIAELYFSRAEADYLHGLDPPAQRREFYRLWTLKESLIKARREGIGTNTMRTRFGPGANTASPWHSYSFTIDELSLAITTSAALAAEPSLTVIGGDVKNTAIKDLLHFLPINTQPMDTQPLDHHPMNTQPLDP